MEIGISCVDSTDPMLVHQGSSMCVMDDVAR